MKNKKINITITEVGGWLSTIKGMRRPKNTVHKIDSSFSPFVFGDDDLSLAKKLIKTSISTGAKSHRKYLRMIQVWGEFTFPLYWWSQFDTYKIGVNGGSESKMHTLGKRELTLNDFQTRDKVSEERLKKIIDDINSRIYQYKITKNKRDWEDVLLMLPISFLQTREINTSYEVLFSAISERRGHKLPEWEYFSKVMLSGLPYFKELTGLV